MTNKVADGQKGIYRIPGSSMQMPPPISKREALLASIYGQMHEHLLAAYKTRDQVIGFYVVVLIATLAAWARLEAPTEKELRELLAAGAALIGFTSFLVVTQYRRWHIVYMRSIAAYQRLWMSDKPLAMDTLEAAWKDANGEAQSVWRLMDPRSGVEIATLYLHGVLTSVPVFLLMGYQDWDIQLPGLPEKIVLFLLGAIVFAAVFAYVSSRFVKRYQCFSAVRKDWMFRWLSQPPDSQSPHGAEHHLGETETK